MDRYKKGWKQGTKYQDYASVSFQYQVILKISNLGKSSDILQPKQDFKLWVNGYVLQARKNYVARGSLPTHQGSFYSDQYKEEKGLNQVMPSLFTRQENFSD